MNCKKIRKTLTAYISNELSGDERRKVEVHLQTCPSCRSELISLRTTREMLGAWDEVDPPEELFDRFKARLAEEIRRREAKSLPTLRWPSSKWLYASITVVCFIASLTLGLYILLSREGSISPGTVRDYRSYGQGDIWVSFYISEHERTLKQVSLQKAPSPRGAPIRVPLRRENILYYDEISGESEELKGRSGLILKSRSGWKGETEGESHKEFLSGEALTLEEARRSVSFDIVAPSIIGGEYRLRMIRKARDKECVQLVYSNGLSVISLFEQPLGAREKLGRRDFREYILRLAKNKGRMAVLGWVTEHLSFNLIGEMALSELMRMAEEIQERCLTDKARRYYQRLYGGDEDENTRGDNLNFDADRSHADRGDGSR
jgi:hypothetical protein